MQYARNPQIPTPSPRHAPGLTPDWPQILVGLTELTLEDPGLQNALGALHGPR